jgi:hypothetical protein
MRDRLMIMIGSSALPIVAIASIACFHGINAIAHRPKTCEVCGKPATHLLQNSGNRWAADRDLCDEHAQRYLDSVNRYHR